MTQIPQSYASFSPQGNVCYPANQGYQTVVPNFYWGAQNPAAFNPASSPISGLYGNFINPSIPVNYTFLGTQTTPYGDNIYLYMLQNGQRVAIMPKKGTTIVKTFVNSGSMNESDPIRGISHFIEHNLFNGSKNLAPGQFFSEVSKMGSSTNASTDYAQTDYYIESALMTDKDLEKTIKMHADMVQNPTFPTDMIEKEKGPVTSEISMVNDDMTTIAANEAIRNLFQIQSQSDNLVAGSIKTVNSLDRNKVVDYYTKHYTPDNLYTVVVGDVDPSKTIQLLAQNFNKQPNYQASSQKKSETLTPIQNSIRVDYKSPNDNCTSIIAAFAGPKAGDFKGNIASQALGVFLTMSSNSRLSNGLEEINGLCDFQMQKVGLKSGDPQAFMFQMVTPSGREQSALDIFYSTIENLAVNPPTSDEMQILKNYLNKIVAVSFQNSTSICNTIGSSLLDGDLTSISEYKNAINALTPQDLQLAAKQFVDLNKASIAVVHPANVSEADIMNNYKKSDYSCYGRNVAPQNAVGQVSFGSSMRITTSDVQEVVLPDNTHAVLNDFPTEPCYFNWKITSKSTLPKNPAAAYVLTEILNNGSKYKSKEQFIKEAELNGISFAADANGIQLTLAGDCLENGVGASIDTMKEALFAPNFSEAEFKKIKANLIEYFYSLSRDASNNILDQLFGSYFARPEQILAGLQTLTLNDVIAHYNNLISNSTSAFVISAPFSKNPNLKNEVYSKLYTPNFKFKELVPTYTPIYNNFRQNPVSKVVIDTEERNQAQINKTYSFKMSGNIEDEIKFELLNAILGGSPSSRLFQDLREKQKLAYRVSSEVRSFEDTGILTLSILSTTDDKKQGDIKYDNLQKSLQGFEAHTQKLMNEPVSAEELAGAKMMLKQAFARQTESPASKTDLLAMNINQPYGIKRIDEYVKAIDKMTPADIQAAARHVFSTKPLYTILASPDTVQNQQGYLNSLGAVEFIDFHH